MTEFTKVVNLLANGYLVSGKLSDGKEKKVSEGSVVVSDQICGMEANSEKALVLYSDRGADVENASLPDYPMQANSPLLSPHGEPYVMLPI